MSVINLIMSLITTSTLTYGADLRCGMKPIMKPMIFGCENRGYACHCNDQGWCNWLPVCMD